MQINSIKLILSLNTLLFFLQSLRATNCEGFGLADLTPAKRTEQVRVLSHHYFMLHSLRRDSIKWSLR